jgi:hypothetical protein
MTPFFAVAGGPSTAAAPPFERWRALITIQQAAFRHRPCGVRLLSLTVTPPALAIDRLEP